MLLERDDLLAGLSSLLEAAATGLGALALVAGEAGAGKTSMVREFLSLVPREVTLLAGACDPLTTPRPLGPLTDIAAIPGSQIGDVDESAPYDVFAAVLRRVRGLLRPAVVVLEDVHWADDGTLDFLRFIGRRIGDSNGLVVATYRDDEVGPEHRLRAVLGQLASLPSTHRFSVPALSVDAVATLAEGSGLDPVRLHRLTGGNAFFVTEVIAGDGELPATVQDAVLARVARLMKGPRRVVEAVAIAPRHLELDHVVALAGAADGDVDAAVAAGVLLADGTMLRFRHELARRAVAVSIPATRRLALHRAMIDLLEGVESPDLARLAHHALEANAVARIIQYAPQAAYQAARRGAHKQAVAFLDGALARADAIDPGRIAELRLRLCDELSLVDRHTEALRQALLAADHYQRVGDDVRLAVALTRASAPQWRLPDPPGATASLARAFELLEPLGPSRELGDVLYHQASGHMLARRLAPARAAVNRAGAIAIEIGDDDLTRRCRLMEGTIEIVMGDARFGARILSEVAADAGRAGDLVGVGGALGMLGSGGGEARLYAEALAALEDGVAHGLAHDMDYSVAYDRAWQARIAFEQGRWDDAVTFAELVDHTSLARSGISMVTAMGALGRVRVRRGDPRGRDLLEKTLAMGSAHELQHVWPLMAGVAEYVWLTGGDEAPDLLVDGYRRALETDSAWARGELGFWMWRLGGISGPPDGAAEPFALHMDGEWRRAASAWRQLGCPYEEALALCEGGVQAVTEAIAIFDSLGARPAANRARARLRDLGAVRVPRGPTRRTRENPAGLTARQLEVLRFMAAGLDNGEIADRLYVSKKTVEHHVSAVFSKLGVDSRARAIAAAHQLGVAEK